MERTQTYLRAGDVSRPCSCGPAHPLGDRVGRFVDCVFWHRPSDAPDFVAQFQTRASVYEARISGDGHDDDMVAAYASYQSFLDAQLTILRRIGEKAGSGAARGTEPIAAAMAPVSRRRIPVHR